MAISRRTWRGVAPRARSTAISRRRWAIASANVPATTNSATAPAIPPIVPKIETRVARSDADGSPASAFAAWSRSSTSTRGPRSSLEPRVQRAGGDTAIGDDADGVDVPRRARLRPRDVGREEQRRLAAVAARATCGEAGDAVGRLAARRHDPQRRADPRAEAGVGDDIARAAGRAAGGQPVRRQRRARPAVALHAVHAGAVQRAAAGVEGAGGEGHVADGARDARDLRGALDGRRGEPRPGDDVDGPSHHADLDRGSARTTASAAARRPGPGALSAPAMSVPVA